MRSFLTHVSIIFLNQCKIFFLVRSQFIWFTESGDSAKKSNMVGKLLVLIKGK